jgi:hypothetical protein
MSVRDDGPTTAVLQRGVVDGWIDPAHQSIPAHADAHHSADHECDAAEHLLLFDVLSAR